MDQSPIKRPPAPNIETHESFRIEWAAETIANEGHPERNEDAILTDPNHRAFGVFDGMGGHLAGDVASTTARNYVLAHLSKISDGTDVKVAEQALLDVIVGADKAIDKISGDSDMGTTSVVLKFHTDANSQNWALIANAGDSRIYKIGQDGIVEQVTIDDDLVNTFSFLSEQDKTRISTNIAGARDLKDLKEDEIFYFKRRNEVTKSLGKGDERPSISAISVKRGDRFLITSDGVHDNLTTSETEEALGQEGTLEYIVNGLIRRAVARSREPKGKEIRAKPDDMSAILVECR